LFSSLNITFHLPSVHALFETRRVANITPSFAVALSTGNCLCGVLPMGSDLESDEVLSAAISGIPKVAELIALIPAEDQSRALEAAEKSYLQTAHNLGYEGVEAREWAAAIMVRLRSHNSPTPPLGSE
jgi:hypothetical protein